MIQTSEKFHFLSTKIGLIFIFSNAILTNIILKPNTCPNRLYFFVQKHQEIY